MMIGGMLCVDDFVGVSELRESLQKLIDVVCKYYNRWRVKANVGKSAVMVFSKDRVEGRWKWLELRGKWMVSYVPQVREEQMVRIYLYVHVCVAPPMIVGMWSMAVMLW